MKNRRYRWLTRVLFGCVFVIATVMIFDVKKSKDNNDKEEAPNDSKIDTQQISEKSIEEEVSEYLDSMELEEKVAQLFVVLPESLIKDVECVTVAGEATKNAINEIPVGGFVYMSNNLQSEEQVTKMLANVQKYSMERIGFPMFLCVDEEGGTVARIGGSDRFDVVEMEDMSVIGQTKDTKRAYAVGVQIGAYLSRLGFNVDFAPVADVLSNSENTVVKRRSFGSDSETVSDMVLAVSEGLQSQGIYSTFKHFPGHGVTAEDTHEGYAYTDKTLEELETCELIPFQIGVENNVPFIMVGHISLPNVIGDNTPVSLSEYIITDLLREKMGYKGIVITDAMNMGAIAQNYSSEESAVMALQAGADIILMPENFNEAYDGVLEAVKDGRLSEERINESIRRILYLKLEM